MKESILTSEATKENPGKNAEAAFLPGDRLVENLVNIGPKMTEYLAEIGIKTDRQIKEIGVVETYRQLKVRRPKVMTRMALFALYGAVTDQNCLDLPEESKHWLEAQLIATEKTANEKAAIV